MCCFSFLFLELWVPQTEFSPASLYRGRGRNVLYRYLGQIQAKVSLLKLVRKYVFFPFLYFCHTNSLIGSVPKPKILNALILQNNSTSSLLNSKRPIKQSSLREFFTKVFFNWHIHLSVFMECFYKLIRFSSCNQLKVLIWGNHFPCVFSPPVIMSPIM